MRALACAAVRSGQEDAWRYGRSSRAGDSNRSYYAASWPERTAAKANALIAVEPVIPGIGHGMRAIVDIQQNGIEPALGRRDKVDDIAHLKVNAPVFQRPAVEFRKKDAVPFHHRIQQLSLIHISEPTRLVHSSRMPSSA